MKHDRHSPSLLFRNLPRLITGRLRILPLTWLWLLFFHETIKNVSCEISGRDPKTGEPFDLANASCLSYPFEKFTLVIPSVVNKERFNMKTIALEFVPPNVEDGTEKAIEEALKVQSLAKECGMENKIRHLMIPGMIVEDDDRPVEMKPKLDPLEVWKAVQPKVPAMKGLCTQVTAFMDHDALGQRFGQLLEAGMEGLIFVGVPRTMSDGEGSGVAPTDALDQFKEQVPNRGVILIPTREGETGRFGFKCRQGATFAMTQLLYSDTIVDFLKKMSGETEDRPSVLLSFGYVPKVEERIGLIKWLIQDPGNASVAAEQEFVARMAPMSYSEKETELMDLYKRVVDGVAQLDFPMGIHLEAPYGFSKPAFDLFSTMLDYYSPDVD